MSLRAKPRRAPRADIDPDAQRYMVYRVHDAAGSVIYVGRSCNVARRLKGHQSQGAKWLPDARSVSMIGPYTWGEACRVERVEIETHQPRGNRQFAKAHGYRPLAEGGGRYIGGTA